MSFKYRIIILFIFYTMIKHKDLYHWTQIIYYILFSFSLLGIYIISPKYLPILTNVIKLYIAILLIWKFNPYHRTNTPIHSHERSLIFSSAIYLLLTTTVGDILERYGRGLLNVIYRK